MISAKELRIGNRLRPLRILDPENIPLLGYMICAGHIAYSEEDLNNDWEPIPITPEILEKCGFKRGNDLTDRNVFYATGIHSQIHSICVGDGGIMLHRSGTTMLLETHIRSLHQLQNIFYCLCGEELTVNL